MSVHLHRPAELLHTKSPRSHQELHRLDYFSIRAGRVLPSKRYRARGHALFSETTTVSSQLPTTCDPYHAPSSTKPSAHHQTSSRGKSLEGTRERTASSATRSN